MAIEDHPRWKQIDALQQSLCNIVVRRQQRHFANKKIFFQGLETPADTCDGETEKAVGYGLKVETLGEVESSWGEFAPRVFKAGYKLPLKIRVDRYDSPKGPGFKVILTLEKPGLGPDAYGTDGDVWKYIHVEGPGNFGVVQDEWHIVPSPPA